MSDPAAIRSLRSGVKRLAAGVDRLRHPVPGVVVLAYHRVGRRTSVEVDLPTSLFEEQCAAIAELGAATTLDDALDELARPEPPPRPAVVVTFDDGTADVIEVALPILERHGLPALLYVATDFIEHGRTFPGGGRPATWRQLADATASGLLSIGSHTDSHALLDRLPPGAVDHELDRSIRRVEYRLGTTPAHFAYPKAVAGSAAADAAVRRRFRSAAMAGTRANVHGATDPYRLARSPVQVSDGMRWFQRKLEGGMGAEDQLRQVLNRRRHRAATS